MTSDLKEVRGIRSKQRGGVPGGAGSQCKGPEADREGAMTAHTLKGS